MSGSVETRPLTAPDGFGEPCTTESQKGAHLARWLNYVDGGRWGRTLCGYAAHDEDRANWLRLGPSPKRLVIADLPECRRCAQVYAIYAEALTAVREEHRTAPRDTSGKLIPAPRKAAS